jgi:hypothetical protein
MEALAIWVGITGNRKGEKRPGRRKCGQMKGRMREHGKVPEFTIDVPINSDAKNPSSAMFWRI